MGLIWQRFQGKFRNCKKSFEKADLQHGLIQISVNDNGWDLHLPEKNMRVMQIMWQDIRSETLHATHRGKRKRPWPLFQNRRSQVFSLRVSGGAKFHLFHLLLGFSLDFHVGSRFTKKWR